MSMNNNLLLKEYSLPKKYSQKLYLSNNISTDFSKNIKSLKNNYTNFNKNILCDKKLFQNIKLYNLIKPNSKHQKKRNYSNSLIHNNLTEGNLINNNSKNFKFLFNSYSVKKPKNCKLEKNFRNLNNNIADNIKSNKLLIKTKSNNNNPNYIKKYQYQNLIINNGNKSTANNNNNNNNFFKTIGLINNLSVKNIKNQSKRISNSCKKNSSYKIHINKFSDNIPKKSNVIQEKIAKYKKQIEIYKKEIKTKDNVINKLNIKLNELNIILEKKEKIIQNINQKRNELEKEYKILKNNFLLLNGKNNENEKNINLMKNKEIKLMQVLYLMKEKGININSFLTQVNHITFVQKNEKENFKENSYNNRLIIKSIRDDESQNENEMSGITVYFPDKIRMNNIMETNWGKNIPKLNFELVPEYSSENNSDKNDQNNIVEDESLEDYQNYGKYQHSV